MTIHETDELATPEPERAAWARSTSWDELGDAGGSANARYWRYRLGDPDDPTAPSIVRTTFAPGAKVPAHTHGTDYTEIILEGSEQVGRRWHRAGDIRIARRNHVYGPITVGPDGLTKLVIFREGGGAAMITPSEARVRDREEPASDVADPEG